MKTILVPLDGSDLAERAIGPARRLATARGASILLLQVVPPHPPAEGSVIATELDRAEAYLASIAAGLRRDGTSVLVEVCTGAPADQIVEQALLWRCDQITMSTHGRSGLSRLPHGSVATAVTQNSPVPVLLVTARSTRAASDREKPAMAAIQV